MSESPALLAVFGNPIAHSLSPLIHQFFAQQEGRSIIYEKRLVEGAFADCAREFFAQGGIGCNVTVPCKVEAFNFATAKTERARVAQAVNTLSVRHDADVSLSYKGDNTDGFGLLTDLIRLKCPLASARVLIIGAGGATRGIVPLLQSLGSIHNLTIVNRTLAKAEEIIAYIQDFYAANHFSRMLMPMRACDYATLEAQKVTPDTYFDVIINATSLSMREELPPVKDEYYKRARFAYDLFYTPQGKTVFTEHAKSLGIANSYDGLGMLVGQAALAYEQWFGVRPEMEPTIEYMRQVLAQR